MSRVRHNAKSIENRYNSLKTLTKCSKRFAYSTKCRHFEKDKFGSSLIFYFVAIQENWRSTIGNPLKMCAETYTRPGTGAPASNYSEDEESSESDNIVDDIDYCPLEIDENPEEANGNYIDPDVSAEAADLADSTSNERERVRHARVKMPKLAQVLNAEKGHLLSKIPKPKLFSHKLNIQYRKVYFKNWFIQAYT
jgi:hypothetical protein